MRVTASPSIAAKWLVPRLDRFLETEPDADVRIDVSATVLDFDRDDVDVAIRFGNGKYPGLRSDKLFQDMLFPVCSPSLHHQGQAAEGRRAISCSITLIHLDWEAQGAAWPNWRMWMQAAGVRDFNDCARPALQPDLAGRAGRHRRARRGAG